MSLIDAHYYEHPYKGAPRMHVRLRQDKGDEISLNRVERLYYKVMGLRAILLGPHISKRHKDHTVYRYLLSRFVLHWSLSNTMEAEWCTDLIREAIALHGCSEILNTVQGAQYTSDVFSQFSKSSKRVMHEDN